MKLKLRNVKGEVVGNIDVREDVFAAPMNSAVVHQVMVGQRANARQGTASTKTRAEVSGGGAKPRPQKHTGRARQGSIRAPQWRGGGAAFGPKPRSYRHYTPKQMKRKSLVAMLSEKVRTGELVVLDNLTLETPKTREMVSVLNTIGVEHSALLVADGADTKILRCASNIPRVKMLPAALLNTVDLLKHRNLVMTLEAVRKAEDLWGGSFVRKRRAQPASSEEDHGVA